MQRFIFFALLAVMLFSSAQPFSVITTYSNSNCTADSMVSRAITPEECPSDTEAPFDTCIENSLNDGSYFFWNSSYCNSTEVPELIPDWYTVYSFREVCNLAKPDLILEVKSATGALFPTTVYTISLLSAFISMECKDNDTLFLTQCVGSNCFNFTASHDTCDQTDVESFIYQTACRDNRLVPVAIPAVSPVAEPVAEPLTATPQAGTTPVTRSSAASATSAIVAIICLVNVALF
jgi:hypothetical protein